jgi:hypothetical protein
MSKKLISCFIFLLLTCLISCGGSGSGSTSTLANGLVAYWAFSEGSGTTVVDSSANDNSGVVVGAEWVTGQSGNALHFDGVDDSVQIPEVGGTPPTDISSLSVGSISIWFKFDDEADATGYYLPVFYIGPAVGAVETYDGVIIEVGHLGIAELAPNNQEVFYTVTTDGTTEPTFCFDSGSNLTAAEWQHFVVTVDSSGNKGYLNGSEMTARDFNFGTATDSYFLDSVSAGLLSIGYGRSATDGEMRYFKGSIDEIRIYNRALTAAEISELYSL